MSRIRNAVIIIILCLIGSSSFKKGPQLGLNLPEPDAIKDAVAGDRVRRRSPKLTLTNGQGEDLRDAVSGHAVGTPNNGNTLDDVGAPPRGSGKGGFSPLATNFNNNVPPNNPPPGLSPSGPQEPPTDGCQGEDCLR